jgi:hypothetical protein
MKVSIFTRTRSEDNWFFDQFYWKRLVHMYLGDAILILNLKSKGRWKWQHCSIPVQAHHVKVTQKLVQCGWQCCYNTTRPWWPFGFDIVCFNVLTTPDTFSWMVTYYVHFCTYHLHQHCYSYCQHQLEFVYFKLRLLWLSFCVCELVLIFL